MRKVKNQAKCKLCGDIIESKFRHDFVWCKCGAIAVDGGQDYQRRIGPENCLHKVGRKWVNLLDEEEKSVNREKGSSNLNSEELMSYIKKVGEHFKLMKEIETIDKTIKDLLQTKDRLKKQLRGMK